HLGQLDDSGLTVADLRRISSSLVETIKHAHHGRIEYQWQRREREAQAAAGESDSGRRAAGTRLERPRPYDEPEGASATQRLLREPRLGSLDAPRPAWRTRALRPSGGTPLETAPTEPGNAAGPAREPDGGDSSPTLNLTRPPTAAEVARATAPEMRAASEPPAEDAAADPDAGAGLDTLAETVPEPPAEAGVITRVAPAGPDDEPDSPFDTASGDDDGAPLDPEDSLSSPATDLGFDREFVRARTEWEKALRETGDDLEPPPGRTPPPPPPGRAAGDSGRLETATGAGSGERPLSPGVMVVGPPPATHPRVRVPRPRAHTIRRAESQTEP